MRQSWDAGGRLSPLPSFERLFAAMIDFVVLLVPEIIAYQLIWAKVASRTISYYEAHPKMGTAALFSRFPGFESGWINTILVVEGVTAVYLIGMYLFSGSTVGKLAMGLRITRVDGTPLRPLDSVLRSLPFWVPLLVPGIGWVVWAFEYMAGTALVLWRPDHRGPEDLLGHSMVVHKEQVGQSLDQIVGQYPGRPIPPPFQPPDPRPRGGHLPGWEPRPEPPRGGHLPGWEPQPQPVPPVPEDRDQSHGGGENP